METPPASATCQACAFDAALVKLARSGVLYGPHLGTALRTVTETAASALAMERVSIWIFQPDGCLECLDLFDTGRNCHIRGEKLCATDAPSYVAALETARALATADAVHDPRTRELEAYLREHGITSMLDAPVVADGRLALVVCHEHVGPPRRWSRAEEEFAAAVADMVALAVQVHARWRAVIALEESNEALRRSEERLRTLVASAPMSLFAVDTSGRLSMVEGNVLRHPTEAPTDLVGRRLAEVVGRECVAGTTMIEIDGRALEIHTACSPATGEHGAETVGVAIDVTERRLAERRLKVLQRLSHAIADARLDPPKMVEAATRVLSEGLESPCAIRLASRAHGPSAPLDTEAVDVPLCTRGEILGVLTVGPNPHRAMTLEPDWIAEVADRLALALDNARLFKAAVEARARAEAAEQRLRVLNEGLERSVEARTRELRDAVRDLDAFSGWVAHDLRAPLRAIRGFSALVLERSGAVLPPEDRALLARVGEAGERMSRLIEDLLHLSTWDRAPPSRARVCLSDMAEGIVRELRRGAPSRDVVVEIAPDLVATGDPGLLRVVLENLLGNAWKFTAKRDRAHIKLGVLPGTDGPRVYFVQDDGAGFDPAHAASIFTPLVRLHPASEFEGTGIGLAIAQRVVKRHGGRIWAEAQENRGATFYFTLEAPEVSEAGSTPTPAKEPAGA